MRRAALVFGEVVVDEYPREEVLAGAALHIAAHLAAAGWRSYLITRVGEDAPGRALLELFERQMIDTSFVETDARLPTGRSTIHTDGLENTFTVHGPAAWDAIEGPARLPHHDAVCYGTLAARAERSRGAMMRLLGATRAAHKVLDVNLRPPHVDRDVLEMTLGAATAVKLGAAELEEVASVLGFAAEPRALFDGAPRLRWVCVTRGDKGAALFERSGASWALDALDVEVTNTVGAGDAFTAGLAEGLVEALRPEEVLDLAQRRAASILAQKGGLPSGC